MLSIRPSFFVLGRYEMPCLPIAVKSPRGMVYIEAVERSRDELSTSLCSPSGDHTI